MRTEESARLIGSSLDRYVDAGVIGMPERDEPKAGFPGKAATWIEQLRAEAQARYGHPWRHTLCDDGDRLADEAHLVLDNAGDVLRHAVRTIFHLSKVAGATKRGAAARGRGV
jgi:hypothetical protein